MTSPSPSSDSKYLSPNWNHMGEARIAIGVVKLENGNYAVMVWDRDEAETHMIYSATVPQADLDLLSDSEFQFVLWPASSWADYKAYETSGEKPLWMDSQRWNGSGGKEEV